MSLSYLVARIADTIADSGQWQTSQRLTYLELWEKAIFHNKAELWMVKDSVGSFSESEAQLLLESPQVLQDFLSFPKPERVIAEDLFQVLFQGMRTAIQKFSAATKNSPVYVCQTKAEFDFYTYSHAGCVGAFWTRAFQLPADLENFAVSYGKALERINILRDVIGDREDGRIFLCKEDLDRFGFTSTEPWNESPWSEFVADYIAETKPLLLQGAFFCDSIPRQQRRLKWASMMPLKIGLKSLELYAKENSKTKTTKITRKEVYDLAIESFFDVLLSRKLSRRSSWKESQ